MGPLARRPIPFRLVATLACFLTFSLLQGCQTTASNEEVGTALGAIVGAVAGAAFGDGGGQIAAVFTGAVVGALAGQIIGKRLDEADRLKAQSASLAALTVPTGETVEWKSNEHPATGGTATPLTDSVLENGRTCRTVREVVVIDGEEATLTNNYCKSEDGRWRAAT